MFTVAVSFTKTKNFSRCFFSYSYLDKVKKITNFKRKKKLTFIRNVFRVHALSTALFFCTLACKQTLNE